MKFSLVIAGLLSLGLVGCTTTPVQQTAAKFEKVYEIPNLSQAKIYDGVRQWYAVAYGSANAVIQYEDKAVGTIIGKGNMKYPCVGVMDCMATANARIEFTSRMDTKDGKVRVSYDSLRYKVPSTIVSGIRYPEVDNPVVEGSKIANNTLQALDAMSSDMVSKIQNNEKISSNW